MPTTLSTSSNPVQNSAMKITMAFTDEDGDAVTPDSITYSLRDKKGAIMNSISGVTATPATSVSVVLSGDDLAIPDPTILERKFTVSVVYDSNNGTDLNLTDELTFSIKPLAGL